MFRRIAIITAGILAGLVIALPAMAQTNPVTNSVSGTVVIPASLTMTLDANSFSVNTQPGNTVNTGLNPFAITATVVTNDGTGYSLSESLASQFSDGLGHAIPNTVIQPYMYSGPGNGQFGGSQGFSFSTAPSLTIAQTNQPTSGDNWGLAWQFAIPGAQAAGTYAGQINVTAIGN